MLALKAFIISFFGAMTMLGSAGLDTLPHSAYTPVDRIETTENGHQNPQFFDAVLDFSHSSTYESPASKILLTIPKAFQKDTLPLFYELSYYDIGQQITVKLSIKAIIFPFHCFT